MIAKKSEDQYTRHRRAASADWGTGQRSSEIVYKATFFPRATYASEI